MSTAAFKKPSAPPQRRTRSLSVTPISRSHLDLDFSNKRDNPLFWANASPPEPQNENENEKSSKEVSRGRSVVRNGDDKKVIGRSLSRVDLGRGRHRSLSRGPSGVNGGPFESEVEQAHVKSISRTTSISNLASSNVKRLDSVRNAADTRGRTRNLPSHSKRHPSVEPSYRSTSNSLSRNWEDGISTGSLSEAEEKTIKAVCEQMKSFQGDNLGANAGTSGIYETVRSEVRRAISDIQNDLGSAIRRNNSSTIATADVTDIPPDLVNPGAVELVLDIRREYARKLEESQERARKLRADLAVEEHRGLELSRILKETLPNPKPTPTIQRPRLGRKVSSERKKISKRLTEEAMSYFDECVSISTFDSSDFSAPEDPPINSVGTTVPVGYTVSLPQESTCVSSSYGPNSRLNHKQESVDHGRLMQSCEDSNLTYHSSSNEPTIDQASQKGKSVERGSKSQFSFTRKPTENVGIRQDIRSYIKFFEKDEDKNGINSENPISNGYDGDGYDLHGRKESLLFDRVLWKNRIESGSLHICGGGISISFSPFASVI